VSVAGQPVVDVSDEFGDEVLWGGEFGGVASSAGAGGPAPGRKKWLSAG
jgi:hypothetical protein